MMQKGKHFYWLDLIRFTAAFVVVAGHVRVALFIEYGLLPQEKQTPIVFAFYSLTRIGHEAVLVFFVLSGFLVGGKTIQRLKEGTFNIQSYTIDRSVRILLPLISTLLLIQVINILTGTETDYITFLGNLLSLQGIFVKPVNGPLWSLSYEVWFYIIIGAIALFFSGTSIKKRLLAFTVLFISSLAFTKLLPIYLAIWFIGAFSYFVTPFKKNKFLLFLSVLLCIGLLLPLQMTSGSHSINNNTWQSYLNRDMLKLLFAFVFGIVIQQVVMFIPKNNLPLKIDRMGTRLANFSYTLYLVHYSVIGLLVYYGYPKNRQIDIQSFVYFLICIVICLIVSYGVYWLFEKRTSAVKTYIKKLTTSQEPQKGTRKY